MAAPIPSEPGNTSLPGEREPIAPEEAEIILQKALHPYIHEGWYVLDRDSFSARLTKGPHNLDVRVDLLGQVEITTAGLTPVQESGRLIAWVLLLVSLLAALVIASILGIL